MYHPKRKYSYWLIVTLTTIYVEFLDEIQMNEFSM